MRHLISMKRGVCDDQNIYSYGAAGYADTYTNETIMFTMITSVESDRERASEKKLFYLEKVK